MDWKQAKSVVFPNLKPSVKTILAEKIREKLKPR
jgi:hypothetical protein